MKNKKIAIAMICCMLLFLILFMIGRSLNNRGIQLGAAFLICIAAVFSAFLVIKSNHKNRRKQSICSWD